MEVVSETAIWQEHTSEAVYDFDDGDLYLRGRCGITRHAFFVFCIDLCESIRLLWGRVQHGTHGVMLYISSSCL